MVVETMTHQEIIDEYKKDWDTELKYKVNSFASNNEYRRYIMKYVKAERHVYFKPIEIKTRSGNTYILHFNTKGYNDFKKNGIMYILYMYYHGKGGIHALMGTRPMGKGFYFYTPHLFDRYRERKLKNIHIPKKDVIIEFFKWNCTVEGKYVDNEKYPNSTYSVSEDGVILGEQLDNRGCRVMLSKTYITYEMLKGTQNDDKETLRTLLLEYMKNEQ